MIALVGGTFLMGSDRHYPEEAPAHRVSVSPIRIDATPVTNAQFRAFVTATGHVTQAEIAPQAEDYPGARPEMLQAGSLTFRPPAGRVSLSQPLSWWDFTFGANWRRPYGKGSDLRDLDQHPVVHVAYADALAYALWAGKDLPTEAEWEFAARGGLEDAEYAWGSELTPGGRHMANTWQGAFPVQNLRDDGYARTSPVRAFPPNGYGIFDMIGNVWEWTKDWYVLATKQTPGKHAASRPTRAARGKTTVTIRRVPKSGFRERCLRVARIFAPRTTAAGTDPLRATRNQLTLLQAMSGFVACCETPKITARSGGIICH